MAEEQGKKIDLAQYETAKQRAQVYIVAMLVKSILMKSYMGY